MSRINFAEYIEDPTYVIGNSSVIHEQIKQALIAEADQNNAFRNFVLAQSGVPQIIASDMEVQGKFTTGQMSTASFDINQDGNIDFTSDVTFQFGSLIQDYIKDGYVDLANDQTVDGIKYFSTIKKTTAPVDTDDLTNKNYVDNEVTVLHDNIQANLDIIETDLLDLHSTKQPNIETTDDFEFHTLTLNGDLVIADAKINKSKIIDLTSDLSTIYSGLTSLQNSKQANLTSNSINDTWLSNNIPRYNIVNVFQEEVVCDSLTVVNGVTISDGALNKSKILDLNTDLSAIVTDITDLQNGKQDNLTNNSINDGWLSGNVVFNNSNQTFQNDVTINGVLYATNMEVTNLTTINQTSTEESILNLTVDDITINANLVMGSASALSLVDGSIAVSKVNNLQNILNAKATTTALTSGLATKQNTVQDGDLSISHINGLSTQLNDRVTYDVYTSGLGGKQNVIIDGDLSISHISGLQSELNTKATTTELNDGLALKQDTIGAGDLIISYVSGLQAELDTKATTTELTTGLNTKQDTIGANDLSISYISGLQAELDAKATSTELTTGLNAKQDTIGSNDLQISYVSGLQAELDAKATSSELTTGLNAKQDTIGSGDLLISYVSGLQTELDAKANTTELTTGLNAKQDTIGANDLSISYISGLQAELDAKATSTELTTGLNAKQDTIGAGDLLISYVSGLQTELDAKATTTDLTTGLNTKQDTIGSNDLQISYISGLQAELDAKATSTELTTGLNAKQDTLTTGSISDGLLASTFLKPDTNLTISSGRTLTLSGSIIANGCTISPGELSYLDNLTEPLPTTLASLQSQIDGIAGSIDLSGYQTLISDSNKIQISNVDGLSTALSGKQATLSNASYLDFTSSGQGQIDAINTTIAGLSGGGGGDLSGYQTLISDSNQIQISNVNGLSTALSGKQATLTTGSVSDSMLESTFVKPSTAPILTGTNFTAIPDGALSSTFVKPSTAPILTGTNFTAIPDGALSSTFVKPSTAPTLEGGNFTGIPSSAIIGGVGLTVETVTGTTAISSSKNISLVSGTTHTLASGSTPGFTKTIVNNNPNAFNRVASVLATGAVTVRCLKYDSVLNRMYIGGNFTNLNGVTNANTFCYYDFATSTFVSLGTFTGTDVYDILISGTRVYITGAFTLVNSVSNTLRIAYYDTSNSSWNAMGTGLSSGNGQRLLLHGGNIYVCGNFALAGGVASTVKIARWNVSAGTWNALGSGVTTGAIVREMAVVGSNIWVCGDFTTAGGASNSTYLAYWDTAGSSWNGYGSNQFNASINAIEYIGGNSLIVGGGFSALGTAILYITCNFNVSTLTGAQYGVGANGSLSYFMDTDGVLWNYANGNTEWGSVITGFNTTYYAGAGSIGFYYPPTNNWVPLTSGGNVFAMERTGTPGEYWLAGLFNGWDGTTTLGFATTGNSSILSFQKNNVTTVNSTLLNAGRTDRNNFNLYYKGQTVNLINLDNSVWATSTLQPSPAPNIWLY
jgi:phosphopantetheine adenylyltransferase